MLNNTYSISEIESKRFGMNILRANVTDIKVNELRDKIIKNNTDIVFLRIPSGNSDQIQNLSKLGFDFFQADTLVYYSVDFNKYKPKELRNTDLVFQKANETHIEVLRELVLNIFNGYTNHYYSNNYLDKTDILAGYAEWVINYINQQDKEVFIVYKDTVPIAFATCSVANNTAEGVLYGVLSEYSGGGIYSDIIRYTQNYFFEKGIPEMKVSTQAQNYAVQKVWCREGFYMNESYATIHINTFLEYSVLPKKEFEFNLNPDLVQHYADVSKDYNEIHFDDEEAIKLGFKSKISHGLIPCGEISRIIGTVFPGKGSVFLSYKNIFLSPLYVNTVYTFVLSTYYHSENGIYMCLVKVLDKENNIQMLSYNQVIKK